MKKLVIRYLFLMFMLVTLVVGGVFGIFYYYSKELPPLSELQNYDMKTGSEVYDINDNLIHVFAVEHRRPCNINELSPVLINGLLAVEDRNFYNHWGIDLRGILRAFWVDVVERGFAQGASTITQQLARNMFLTLDKQIPRKIKESLLAMQIEQNFSKNEILSMYLDKVYLGAGVYGVEAASHRYFSKEAKDLDIHEIALLIGLIQRPSALSPVRFPDRALRRRNIVLHVMYTQGVIDIFEYEKAMETPLEITGTAGYGGSADYFLEHVRRKVERKYGTNRLFTDGLKIYTTLDANLQVYADSVMNRELTVVENRMNYEFKFEDYPPDSVDVVTPYLQGGLMLMDNQTGFVRALIGGRSFQHSKFNRILQARRQPGSAFKPLVYTAAIDRGYTPSTIIKDEPVVFVQSDSLFWSPKNYTPDFSGYIRLREGLNRSINTIAVKIVSDLGPSVIVDYARKFGITTQIRPYYSISIGSFEVFPKDLIASYSTFANHGERVNPIFIRRIEDKFNNVLEIAEIERIRVVDERTAYLMANLLETVIDEGTGRGVRLRGYNHYAAGKTGTTDDYRDAWFIGFNREFVLGIWVGFDNNKSLGRNQSGAVAALPSWPHIMQKAIESISYQNDRGEYVINTTNLEIIRPNGIISKVVSKNTGNLPKFFSEETIEELFITGTEPTPVSDSLFYNFYPTMYRENSADSLIFDLGGHRKKIIGPENFNKNDLSYRRSSQLSPIFRKPLNNFDKDDPNVYIPNK